MGEGGWCFALCELRGDNAGTPELIKNYCSGAAGFAKLRQVFTELLWTSCRLCNYMLVFLSTTSVRCIQIPLGFAKLRQVFAELLWTSCRRLICNYMLVFLSTSSERCTKIPLLDLLNVKRSYPNCCQCPLSSLNYFVLLWVVHLSVVSFARRT